MKRENGLLDANEADVGRFPIWDSPHYLLIPGLGLQVWFNHYHHHHQTKFKSPNVLGSDPSGPEWGFDYSIGTLKPGPLTTNHISIILWPEASLPYWHVVKDACFMKLIKNIAKLRTAQVQHWLANNIHQYVIPMLHDLNVSGHIAKGNHGREFVKKTIRKSSMPFRLAPCIYIIFLGRSTSDFDVRLVIEPIQISGPLSAALFGCLSCQSYVYFTGFTNDHLILKAAQFMKEHAYVSGNHHYG
ncbi:uncharacterized protein HD556DRAFT_1310330 [Suillus plorans]|uniref:Uncharacterized protein n=1 Tax=Suillus plorans TaxID=116603 RepID=A0A9P7DED5_9AGAM|nr:uncharacterized protein HD556DRAFT_1310330 [Suillus plorans]KAG1790784.1 hypothetical protein HD556DRAFT_1310330 [Suillus plorans]